MYSATQPYPILLILSMGFLLNYVINSQMSHIRPYIQKQGF